jgi:hypothetical protein
MLQRLNYTGRIELSNNDVSAKFQNIGSLKTILLTWKLGIFNFSSSSEIIVDLRAAGTTETRRIFIGNVDQDISQYEIDISQMRNPELAKIRFKVCEKDNLGISRIKAQIDNLVPKNSDADDNARSFLKLAKDDELDVPWELRFEAGEPCLFITGKKELYHQLRNRSPWFLPSIMHEVVRQVFLWLIDQSDYENLDIAEKWKQFFIELGCDSDIFNAAEELDLIERREEVDSQLRVIIQSFVRRHNILNQLASLILAEGE